MSVKPGVIPDEIASSGWAIVYPYGIDPKIQHALRQLVEHRRRQATSRHPKLFKELRYRPGTDKRRFLRSLGALPDGPVDPEVVPYYLLLVGSPQQIPFSFQYDLAVKHAVGRLFFGTPEEYARSAQSVVEAENRSGQRPRCALLFGPWHPDDPPTADTVEKLILPLSKKLAIQGWQLDTLVGEAASKTALCKAFAQDSPALLFTAGHGLLRSHRFQHRHQGALLTSDWSGPKTGPPSSDHYFSAEDLGTKADVFGMIMFHLACSSAGTPKYDYYQPKIRIAESDFIALLPQRLLAHPNGSALAVIGHVDRAWTHSFLWEDVTQVLVYECALIELMNSVPVGRAMRYFGKRSAELANDVATRRTGQCQAPDDGYSEIWRSYQDARSYLILGDPAVRLIFAEGWCED